MRRVARKGRLFGAVLMLAFVGVGVGALASSLTSATMKWQAPPRFPMTEPINQEPLDQGQAGRSWARVAFDGGLRRCPQMNAGFLAACEAEMKALSERPALPAGSYGGPLLITKVEPVSEPDYDEYLPSAAPVSELIDYPAQASLNQSQLTPENYPAVQPAAVLESKPLPSPFISSEVEKRLLDFARSEREKERVRP